MRTVREVLAELPKGETLHYLPNPGNAGDSLIAAGTLQVFDELGLSVEIIDRDDFDATDKLVAFGGGGNFNHLYSDTADFVRQHHAKAKAFILLPHTVTANEELLSQLGENCFLFAREQVTFEHLTQHCVKAQVGLDHDMALHLDPIKFLQKPVGSVTTTLIRAGLQKLFGLMSGFRFPPISKLLEIIRFELTQSVSPRPCEPVELFRTDCESNNRQPSAGNMDLSEIYALGTSSRFVIELAAQKFLKNINKYGAVQTDRLHVCIGASLLGKDVHFHSNSYFKCKAIYEHSLKERFPNIHWQG